ncbi:MAG: hemerythrin domain-containing protein [Acidobacteria bacterium]|nr:hemerythrin domain-containing protein [Acidobacteriota bacterium]
MAPPREQLLEHCKRDHEWLLERLRKLDDCLDHLFFYGEVCSDLGGFDGLRHYCRELEQTLKQHIPEEEKMFAPLESREDVRPLLRRLLEEHCTLAGELALVRESLEALASGELLPDDLFSLQERIRRLSNSLQEHIATENLLILPLLQPA